MRLGLWPALLWLTGPLAVPGAAALPGLPRQDNSAVVTRHQEADVFTIPGPCEEACMVLSKDTASPLGPDSPWPSLGQQQLQYQQQQMIQACSCQCNFYLPIFREDLQMCVDRILECDAGSFANGALLEKVPYVFLPQYGMIVHPEAELKLDGLETPACYVTGVQQLGKAGFLELRNLSDFELPLRFHRDEGRAFLQWVGDSRLRETAEGKILLVRLACKETSPGTGYSGYFTPCVAFRVAGSPVRSTVREVSFFSPDDQQDSGSAQGSQHFHQSLTRAEYVVLGCLSVLLALVYVSSVTLYLHGRKSRRKHHPGSAGTHCHPEIGIEGAAAGSGSGRRHHRQHHQQQLLGSAKQSVVKANPLLGAGRLHFASVTASEPLVSSSTVVSQNDKLLERFNPSAGSHTQGDESVTAAVVHSCEESKIGQNNEQNYSGATIVAERIPEENVRIVETNDHANHQAAAAAATVFPCTTQRKKLYFNPAYFDRQLLKAPPPAAVEFLLKIREVIAIAKHKMQSKRFVPSLIEIPEENAVSDNLLQVPPKRKRPSSVAGLSYVQQLRCTGCPGCREDLSPPKISSIIDQSPAGSAHRLANGDSRVRAWLENVAQTPKKSSWRLNDDNSRNTTHIISRSLPSLVDIAYPEQKSDIVDCKLRSNWQRALEDRTLLPTTTLDNRTNKQSKESRATVDDKSHPQIVLKTSDYETDSLERTKADRTSSSSPSPTEKSSPKLARGVPEKDELTIQNAIFNTEFDRVETPDDKSETNNFNLPEVIPIQLENYALVSEVYVNDTYASPTCSDDDSGPEIQYEPENPGHLTIKVQDSPKNYTPQEESEYEPDTLDRKPMRLKINGDITYEPRNAVDEVYVDSLERTTQILLKSKRSFKDDEESAAKKAPSTTVECNKLREIYEARLKHQHHQHQFQQRFLSAELNSWRRSARSVSKLLQPRYEKRQRKFLNHPDVVPKPPPSPPDDWFHARNNLNVIESKSNSMGHKIVPLPSIFVKESNTTVNGKAIPIADRLKFENCTNISIDDKVGKGNKSMSTSNGVKLQTNSAHQLTSGHNSAQREDSAYISSPSSESSRELVEKHGTNKIITAHRNSYSSEDDSNESLSVKGEESGAESIGTDSVLFGTTRKIQMSSLSH